MTQSWRSRCWKFTLASAFFIGGALASLGDGAKAQIVPDQTLPVNSKVSALAGCSIVCFISIENGTQVGNNLFHSFKQFSVGPDDIASFKSDPGIVNIISRVTGSSVSNINGLVTAEGSRANLFLINPNGIILGPNAALDIGGSFVATTANAIEFGNQGFFSASAANVPPPTLTVNPSALLFNQIANQSINSIQVNKAILSVRDAQSLLLVGTDVRLDGGKLLASGGRVELGGLAGQGKVGLQFTDNNFSLSYPNSVARADVSLTNQAVVAVEAGGGGSIAINARNIDVLGESLLSAGIYKGLGSPGSQAGDITLNATGKITIENSQIYNAVDKRAVGNGGNINITADSLTVADVPLLSAETLGQGNAGNISVQVQNSVSVKNSFILNGVRPTGVGNGGNISIRARSVSLTDRGVLSSATNGQGKAGNIELNASDSVNLSSFLSTGDNKDSGGVFTNTEGEATDQGGDIRVTTNVLRLSDGAVLNAQTETAFKGGSITVNVNILELARGGQLVTTALSSGNAGNITVNATDSVTISGSNPNFNNRLKVDREASGLFARTEGAGVGGTLQITTGQLQVLDGAKVVVSSTGSGDAGNLEASANSIRLDRAILSAETTAGQGNINLRSGDLVLRRGSKITTDATGRATGGNITINTDNLVAIPKEDSDIRANAAESFGGRVIINAKGIFGIQFRERDTPLSDITARSDLGPEFSGTVQINTPDADPSRGLTNLPTDLVDASNQIAQNCATGGAVAREQSSFVVIGRGGLPPNPKEPLSSDDVRVDLVTLNPKSEYRSVPSITNNPISPTPAPLVEATGWVINAKGEVVLTAYAPNVTPHSSWQKPTECRASKSALRY